MNETEQEQTELEQMQEKLQTAENEINRLNTSRIGLLKQHTKLAEILRGIMTASLEIAATARDAYKDYVTYSEQFVAIETKAVIGDAHGEAESSTGEGGNDEGAKQPDEILTAGNPTDPAAPTV